MDFFTRICKATLLHIKEDFYIPAMEALTNFSASLPESDLNRKRISSALNLLDAHVYQKVNDYQAGVKSKLAFIRACHEFCDMRLLQHLALQVAY